MIKVGFITNYFIFLFSKSKQPPIRTLKKTVRWVIGIILGIYIGTIILLNIPYIQRKYDYVCHKRTIPDFGYRTDYR